MVAQMALLPKSIIASMDLTVRLLTGVLRTWVLPGAPTEVARGCGGRLEQCHRVIPFMWTACLIRTVR